MPLAVFIVALLATGVAIAFVRGGDETPMAGDSPSPTFTITTASPDPSVTTSSPTDGTTAPPTSPATSSPTDTPTDTPTETPTTSPTTTGGTQSPTSIPPTATTVLPTSTGGGLPQTGGAVGGWLFAGLALMLLSTALMRAVTRRPA